MAAAAYFLLASAAPSLPARFHLPATATTRSLSIPASSAPKTTTSCSLSIRSRRPTVRRNAAETYVPGSGKYIAPDYLVKKVSAKEVEELVRGERKVPLIVDFYATWCGPCVLMAQDIEMLAVEYEDNALFVKVDTDDEYEFARDMQVRGLPTLYFFSPDQSKDAIRTEGQIPIEMIRNIIDNEL
ncbi:thioredoxin-like protein CITRX, chloroplastic [Lolium rigidum]|uniref:thioredoxin-like protein CITRX, chloroplastic n=1 Tax=Lolium rigidum TaxID=89674 RepID=UPI001F5E2B36|nr:thioredoxin-like protein CITRX, chloroplastic [Lolium rigidum]